MNSDTRQKLDAWLRYFDDMGVGPYFRDRLSADSPVSPSPEAQAARSAAKSPPPSAPKRPPVSVIPVLQAPTLFDSVDRIEGDTLERTRQDLGECTRCKLHRHRTNIVFGVGNAKAQLVFVGEGPGHDEDVQGLPFVGRAGRLLTQMIEAMGLKREDVYICNIIKCRPPENRTPEKDEIANCSPFLVRQLSVIAPRAIVCLGSVATQCLLGTNKSISHLRGQWFDYHGARLMATYHPAYLLRNPNAKGEVWTDLKKVIALLGLQPRRAPR